MNKIYFYGAGVAVCAALYFCGRTVGASRCRADTATANMQTQIYLIKQTEKVNAEVFNLGVGDIRRILHEKYTIAE